MIPEILTSKIKISIEAKPCGWVNEHGKPSGKMEQERFNRVGIWGWCNVTVIARISTFFYKLVIPYCSYESEYDFRCSDRYYKTVEQLHEILTHEFESYADRMYETYDSFEEFLDAVKELVKIEKIYFGIKAIEKVHKL